MLTAEAKGVSLVLPTPFADSGELDPGSTDRLAHACLEP
ncbi:hypothetical protein SAMN05216548_10340 [Faunimonas pinastri]|uniref:Dihydrodipicolinate synthase family protein n=1 Tax=Faunimonas pinastri TaxID=1855383 RepID=A0A1H9E1L5_9HYPH|nr:hypothetical protein SAMN05216548_10340 [Faunimonas pinastri]